MPRVLPWANGASRKTSTAVSTPAKSRKRERKDASSSEDESDRSKKRKPKAKTDNSGLPEEKFMVEGARHDDGFRMVEDELYSIANRFTGHIHNAAYKRLVEEAKTRNAQTIDSLARPVVGASDDPRVQHRQAGERKRVYDSRLQSLVDGLGIKKETHDGDGDEDTDGVRNMPFMKTSLFGLMTSPKKTTANLSKILYSPSSSRTKEVLTSPMKTQSVKTHAQSNRNNREVLKTMEARKVQRLIEQPLSRELFQSMDLKTEKVIQAPSKQFHTPTESQRIGSQGLKAVSQGPTSKSTGQPAAVLSIDNDNDPFGFTSHGNSSLSVRLQKARQKREKQAKGPEEETRPDLSIPRLA